MKNAPTSARGVHGSWRRGMATAMLSLVALAPALAAISPDAPPADAAAGESGKMNWGAGINQGDPNVGSLSAFHNGKNNVWCVEPRVNPVPAGGTWTSMGNQGPDFFTSRNVDHNNPGHKEAVSPDAVARASAAMYDNRNTNDKVTAAAMEVYVWSQIAPLQMRFDGDANQRAQQIISDRGGALTDQIWLKYVDLVKTYASVKAAPNIAEAPGSISVGKHPTQRGVAVATVDAGGAFQGGKVELTANGGAFDTNNNNRWDADDKTTITVNDGDKVNVVPTNNLTGNVTVKGKATSKQQFFKPELEVLAAKLDGEEAQKTGQYVAPVNLTAPMRAAAPFPVQVDVHPNVSTKVTEEAQYVNAGESLTDQWTLGFAKDEQWPTDVDSFALNGTLYGPFDEVPAATENGKAPEGAPVFETFENLTVTDAQRTVDVTSKPVTEKGYYVFVGEVNYINQSDEAKKAIPENYAFADEFGLVNETALRIADITTKAQPEAMITGEAADTAIVNGRLPEGAAVKSTLYDNNGTPGDTSDDKVLGTSDVQEIPAGVYTDAEFTLSSVNVGDPFENIANGDRAKFDEQHSTYWVEELLINEKVEYTGKRETPEETTDVPRVEVTTKAQDEVGVYGYAHDTATVTGLVAPNSTLEFTAYHDNGTPGDTSDDTVVGEPVSVVLNETAEGEPGEIIHMDGTEVESPKVKFPTTGVTYWQERLYYGEHLVHEGEPELPNETTNVVPPTVETKADEKAAVGQEFSDVAIIDGRIEEGNTVGFEAYQKVEAGFQKVNHNGELLWNEDGSANVWTQEEIDALGGSDKVCDLQQIANIPPVPVEAGVHNGLEIRSSSITTQLDADVYWVETLYSADGDVIHRGECGIPNETTTVERPKVRTEATGDIVLGESARDTAIVDGLVAPGDKLTFELFYIPEGYDNSVNTPKTQGPKELPVAPTATPSGVDAEATPEATEDATPAPTGEATEDATPAPTGEAIPTTDATPGETEEAAEAPAFADPRLSQAACLNAELVYSSKDQPVELTAGQNNGTRYESPEFTPTKTGTYFWVETVTSADGSIVHRGACGAEGETTKVVAPAAGAAGLSNTGSGSLLPMIGIAGAFAVVGATGLALARRKRDAQ